MADLRVVRSELILGGQKSGKTARAESLAAAWLARSPEHRAVYIATAQAWDHEMRERIARHQRERAIRVPGMRTVEEPTDLARAMARHSRAGTLLVVDCLTLWLTGLLMPAAGAAAAAGLAPSLAQCSGQAGRSSTPGALIQSAVSGCAGPVVLVSNEIGLGVVPMGREVRVFVDALGRLNQETAAGCERVTLMAAGLPLTLKGRP